VEVFKIKEAAALAGNEQDRSAAVTVDLELHIPVQMTGPMLEIANIHNSFLSPYL